ncbi:MAG: SPOR domain-containing protein, partial [Alistipes sp.]|nr:SPOR domain-containing protein [Alistipes sp.]
MRKIYITLTFLLISAAVAAQELPTPVEARIAGLEQNEEYMSLLREDALLQQREDSIATAVVGVRNQLRQDPQNRAKYAELIMQAENEIFEVRNTKGRIIDRINTI